MLHAVIMAGGSGTRFWPESRADRPKQLLRLLGQKTMLRATVDRLAGLVPRERILVATTARLAALVGRELAELKPTQVLTEPLRRNTAPCIGLAALLLRHVDAEATMAVMPADHLIRPPAEFCRAMRYAAGLVEADPARLVTFGIRPAYPAETFGYIERGAPLEPLPPPAEGAPCGAEAQPAGPAAEAASPATALAAKAHESKPPAWPPAFAVRCFREKPDAQTARQYLAAGTFYWNSGMFVWRAATILDCLRRFQPAIHAGLERIGAALGQPDFEQVLRREFENMPDISIDYAVMEKAQRVVVVEAPFEWDDVGSWLALERLCPRDEQGNTVLGRHLGIDTTGTIVRTSDDHLVVTLGLHDCLVVHTADATLVADKHQEEAVRKVVELLAERGWSEFL